MNLFRPLWNVFFLSFCINLYFVCWLGCFFCWAFGDHLSLFCSSVHNYFSDLLRLTSLPFLEQFTRCLSMLSPASVVDLLIEMIIYISVTNIETPCSLFKIILNSKQLYLMITVYMHMRNISTSFVKKHSFCVCFMQPDLFLWMCNTLQYAFIYSLCHVWYFKNTFFSCICRHALNVLLLYCWHYQDGPFSTQWLRSTKLE